MKTINRTGYFATTNHLVVIGNHIDLSKTTIRVRLQSLVNKKLARIITKRGKKVGIQLVSYDVLWQMLGFERSETTRGYKGCLKIYKIPTNALKTKKDLLNHIYAFDCYKKFQRCRYNSQSSSLRTIDISQLSMALMFGFQSRMTACRIQKQLNKDGFLQVFNNTKTVDKVHILQYKQKYTARRTIFVHDQKGYGFVKERLCNSLWVNVNCLSINNPNTYSNDIRKVIS